MAAKRGPGGRFLPGMSTAAPSKKKGRRKAPPINGTVPAVSVLSAIERAEHSLTTTFPRAQGGRYKGTAARGKLLLKYTPEARRKRDAAVRALQRAKLLVLQFSARVTAVHPEQV